MLKQFCPKCRQWHDTDTHFCPNCDVVLYTEKEVETQLNKHKSLKILTRKQVKKINSLGTFFIIASVFLIMFGYCVSKEPDGIFDYIVLIVGFGGGAILFALGIRNCSTYSYYNKKIVAESQNNRPIIICPYCHSDNTIKITSIDRVGSVLLTGVGSGKIGKQWHCNNCKSDF